MDVTAAVFMRAGARVLMLRLGLAAPDPEPLRHLLAERSIRVVVESS